MVETSLAKALVLREGESKGECDLFRELIKAKNSDLKKALDRSKANTKRASIPKIEKGQLQEKLDELKAGQMTYVETKADLEQKASQLNTSLAKKEKDLLIVAQQESTLSNKVTELESEAKVNGQDYDTLFEENQSLKYARDDLKKAQET